MIFSILFVLTPLQVAFFQKVRAQQSQRTVLYVLSLTLSISLLFSFFLFNSSHEEVGLWKLRYLSYFNRCQIDHWLLFERGKDWIVYIVGILTISWLTSRLILADDDFQLEILNDNQKISWQSNDFFSNILYTFGTTIQLCCKIGSRFGNLCTENYPFNKIDIEFEAFPKVIAAVKTSYLWTCGPFITTIESTNVCQEDVHQNKATNCWFYLLYIAKFPSSLQ